MSGAKGEREKPGGDPSPWARVSPLPLGCQSNTQREGAPRRGHAHRAGWRPLVAGGPRFLGTDAFLGTGLSARIKKVPGKTGPLVSVACV